MRFEHEVIDDSPPCGRLFACEPADLTGNGRPDLIVGGTGAEKLPVINTGGLPLVGRFFRRLEDDLFWYENPGWERHVISSRSDLRALGATLGDVTGNGRLDLLVGQAIGGNELYWFEQPADPREPWAEHRIGAPFEKYHDLAFADVDGDGDPELVGASQRSEVVFYYDVPPEPTRTPWPETCRHVVARGTSAEGLAVVDLDGDGRNELVAGTDVYRRTTDDDGGCRPVEADGGAALADGWRRESIVDGWEWTRVAVGDLDGDDEPEVVLSEGDSPALGGDAGRVAWFEQPADPQEPWTEHRLHDGLYCPHTLQLADFDGDGRLDVYVAEMGLKGNDAEHRLFRNRGGGRFEETVVERRLPTHEAKAVDVDGDGRVDVIGKSYCQDAHIDVWYNRP